MVKTITLLLLFLYVVTVMLMFRNAALLGCNNLVRLTYILYYTMIITQFIFSTLFQNIQPLIKHCNNITLIIIHILIFTIIKNITIQNRIGRKLSQGIKKLRQKSLFRVLMNISNHCIHSNHLYHPLE